MEQVSYREFSVGSHTFRVPASGYFFNNRDCWGRIDGSRARVGASDFVQQNAGEVLSFDPPRVGLEYVIFDDICTLGAAKTTIDIVSPVTGRLVSVNQELIENPGLMNEEPYERGWAVELELTDIDEDIESLLDCERYYDIAKAKIERVELAPAPVKERYTDVLMPRAENERATLN
jgi:glycine cleavage system H protein